MKKLLYLFIAVAATGIIIASCGKDDLLDTISGKDKPHNENTGDEKAIGNCGFGTSYELGSTKYKVDYDMTNKYIYLINRQPNPDDTCKFSLTANNKIKTRVSTVSLKKYFVANTFTSYPVSTQLDTIEMPTGNDAYIDIVKNNFKFPATEVLKIIGTDDLRNDYTTAAFAIGNLDQGDYVYIEYIAASGGNPEKIIIGSSGSEVSTQSETGLINKASIQADNQ